MRPILLVIVLIISAYVLAISASVLAYPSSSGYVTDLADVINDASQTQLEAKLAAFEKNSTIEIAVVTVSSLDGLDVDTYAVELFKKLGIGKRGTDNGLLILVAPLEKKWRIEVGYGLEGVITDAKSGFIAREYMLPYFRQAKFELGIVTGVDKIIALLQGHEEVVAQTSQNSIYNYIIELFVIHWIISMICFGLYKKTRSIKKYGYGSIPWIIVVVIMTFSLIIGGVLAVFTLVFLISAFADSGSGNLGRHRFGGVGGFGGGGLGSGGFGGGFGGFGGGGSGGGGSSGGW